MGAVQNIRCHDGSQFSATRIYYIKNVPSGEVRGLHAHKRLNQVLVMLKGSIELVLSDGIDKKKTVLEEDMYQYICPGIWRELKNFDNDCLVGVMASREYEEDDYIYDYNSFTSYKGV